MREQGVEHLVPVPAGLDTLVDVARVDHVLGHIEHALHRRWPAVRCRRLWARLSVFSARWSWPRHATK